MVNYDHVGQVAAVVRFYPALWIFVIGVPDSDVAFEDVLRNDVVSFLDIFGALPICLTNLQFSDSLSAQDKLGLVRADEVEVPVVTYHPPPLNFPWFYVPVMIQFILLIRVSLYIVILKP